MLPSSSPTNGSALKLTGNPDTDDIVMWQESAANVWSIMAEQQKLQDEEDDPTKPLPRGDRGKYYGFGFDETFRRLDRRIFNPDRIALKTYRLMIQDSQIASAIQVINASTVGGGFEIVGGDPKVRRFLERMYARLPMQRVFKEVLSAFWVGYSVTEKVFGRIPLIEDGKEVMRHVIKRYKTLPPETFDGGLKVSDNGKIERIIQDGSPLGIAREISFPPEKINIFTYDGGLSDAFGNFYGSSGLKPIYKDWFFKEWIQKHQNKYLELVAGGILVANAGKGNRKKLAKALNLLKSNANIVLKGAEQKIELIKPAPAGSAFMESVHYHDSQIMKALLVPVLLLGQSSKFGSRNLSETHFRLFQQSRIEPLQRGLEEWVQNDIIQIVKPNFGRQEEYPRFRFKFFSIEQQEKNANFVLKLIKGGVLRTNDTPDIREFVGWKVAEFDEIGDSFIPSGNVGRAGASGSAGDSVTRGTGAEVGGADVSEKTEQLANQWHRFIQISDMDELKEGFDNFLEQLNTTLGSFLEEMEEST